MDELSRKAVLLHLIKKLEKQGSWCGETHIQKSAYVLNNLFQTFEDFEFILYKYGPYSFDLNSELASMLADGFLKLGTGEKYGPKFTSGSLAWFLTKHLETMEYNEKQFEFVAEHLGSKTVKELEPLATALMLATKVTGDQAVAELLRKKKPHIDEPTAVQAVIDSNNLRKLAAAIK